MNREYKDEDREKYVGKWCLTKRSYNQHYNSIYVFSINDGIICYTSETGHNVEYEDVDNFKFPSTFFVNPTPPDFVPSRGNASEVDIVKDDKPTNFSWWNIPLLETYDKVKDFGNRCNHEWSYYDLTVYPPIHCRKCIKCGLTQHMSRTSGIWVDGEYAHG